MGLLATWLATTIATIAAIWFVPGIEAVGGQLAGPVACALVLSFINATIKPVAQFLSIPITILTLGIFYIVVNAGMLELASYLSRNLFHAGIAISSFRAAFTGAIIVSIVSLIVNPIVEDTKR